MASPLLAFAPSPHPHEPRTAGWGVGRNCEPNVARRGVPLLPTPSHPFSRDRPGLAFSGGGLSFLPCRRRPHHTPASLHCVCWGGGGGGKSNGRGAMEGKTMSRWGGGGEREKWLMHTGPRSWGGGDWVGVRERGGDGWMDAREKTPMASWQCRQGCCSSCAAPPPPHNARIRYNLAKRCNPFVLQQGAAAQGSKTAQAGPTRRRQQTVQVDCSWQV